MSEDGELSTEARARAATDKEAMKEAMAELLSELPVFRALLEDKGRRDDPAGDGSSSRASGHQSSMVCAESGPGTSGTLSGKKHAAVVV